LRRTLIVISSGAGSVTPQVRQRVVESFPRAEVVEFDGRLDVRRLLPDGGRVIAVGGDGTIEAVARQLVGSGIALGVISLGTYNNFGRGLGLPLRVGPAIAAIKAGRPRWVTVGSINGRIFLEAAAIGLFGQAIAAGESAKERRFGELRTELRQLSGARAFEFSITGDVNGRGTALSLVFANAPSVGAGLAIGTARPIDAYLELSVLAGRTRRDVVTRVVRGALGGEVGEEALMTFRFRRLEVSARPRVTAYADTQRAGRTPLVVEALPKALRVILPPAAFRPTGDSGASSGPRPPSPGSRRPGG
jgi:diacylglycerol kinase family enzyme